VRLAASNIGWSAGDDERALALLVEHGLEGLEVAPGRVFGDVARATVADAVRVRREVEARGLRVVAMQALLFGRPELAVFGDEASRRATIDWLEHVIALGAALGAHALVFGSPRNRLVGGMPKERVRAIAREVFGRLGDHAAARGTCLCVEPNPIAYGADWVTSVAEAIDVVRDVGSSGFGLHLDAGSVAMSGEPVEETLAAAGRSARHFHASEPQLAPAGSGGVDHGRFAAALRASGYQGWVSLEMRAPPGPDSIAVLRDALAVTRAAYGG
jgi:sugar phosphate isomerase/epimerase